jgi:hypothetical protein
MELLSGNFIQDEAFSRRSIVLDELAAWQLFGAIDINGFTVKLQNQTMTVAGVVRLPRNWQNQISLQDRPQAFVLYETLQKLDPRLSITSYEVRLPEPVQGMGESFLRDAVSAAGLSIDSLELVDQSARLRLWPLLASWRNVGKRALRDAAIVLPWWENATRAAIDLSSLLAQLAAGTLVVLTGSLIHLRTLPVDRKKQLSAQLGLAALTGTVVATFFIQTRGQWTPSGFAWLLAVLSSLALPQVIYLVAIGWAALRRTFPDTLSLRIWIQNKAEAIHQIIKQLADRLSAKKETSL